MQEEIDFILGPLGIGVDGETAEGVAGEASWGLGALLFAWRGGVKVNGVIVQPCHLPPCLLSGGLPLGGRLCHLVVVVVVGDIIVVCIVVCINVCIVVVILAVVHVVHCNLKTGEECDGGGGHK